MEIIHVWVLHFTYISPICENKFLFKHPSWSSWLLLSGYVNLSCWRKLIHFTITFSFSLPYFPSPLWVKLWYFFLYIDSFSFAVFFSLRFSSYCDICHVTFLFVCFAIVSIPFAKPPFLLILMYHLPSVPWKTFSVSLSEKLVPGVFSFYTFTIWRNKIVITLSLLINPHALQWFLPESGINYCLNRFRPHVQCLHFLFSCTLISVSEGHSEPFSYMRLIPSLLYLLPCLHIMWLVMAICMCCFQLCLIKQDICTA